MDEQKIKVLAIIDCAQLLGVIEQYKDFLNVESEDNYEFLIIFLNGNNSNFQEFGLKPKQVNFTYLNSGPKIAKVIYQILKFSPDLIICSNPDIHLTLMTYKKFARPKWHYIIAENRFIGVDFFKPKFKYLLDKTVKPDFIIVPDYNSKLNLQDHLSNFDENLIEFIGNNSPDQGQDLIFSLNENHQIKLNFTLDLLVHLLWRKVQKSYF